MNRIIARWLLLPVLLVALVAAAACGSSSSSTKSKSSTSTTAGAKLAAATLNGSGSTFQAAYDQAAIAAFKETQPDVTINYGGGGSTKGKTDLQNGVVDFAGSDSLVKPEDVAKYKGAFLYFPTVAAPITVVYNLSGVSKLQFSPDTLAQIFEAKITKWNDTAIKADNPGVTLPSTDITVVHRSDGSGTTSNFTKYLMAAAPSTWTLGAGDTVPWPASTQSGNGNPGVAQAVKTTDGAIGYVDFSDAKAAGLKLAAIKNKAGKYVAPSLAGASAAVAQTTVNPDLTYNPLNAAGATSYPIATPTWILVYKNQTDPAKAAALKAWLTSIYGAGQPLASTVNFAALPGSLVAKAKAQLSQIVSSG